MNIFDVTMEMIEKEKNINREEARHELEGYYTRLLAKGLTKKAISDIMELSYKAMEKPTYSRLKRNISFQIINLANRKFLPNE